MNRIPRALRPWARELTWLRPEVSSVLGPWLTRLSALIGTRPARGHQGRPTGDPDGYSGLTRRGPFDRLLATEWALMDAVPAEFLRRAAERELLFVELDRAEPEASRRTIVLFDAGPEQAGAPRLVHLAVLLVLNRRAIKRGGLLHWGHLQHPLRPLNEGVDAGNIAQLFKARTCRRPDGSMGIEPEEDDEIWTVGGPSAGTAGAIHLEVRDPYDPERPELEVVLHDGRQREPLNLTLPPDETAAEVIRRPGSDPKPAGDWHGRPSVRFNLSHTALLVQCSRHLHVIRMSKRGWQRATMRWMQGTQTLVAAGWFNQRSVWITEEDRHLQAHGLFKRPNWDRDAQAVPIPASFAMPSATGTFGDLLVLPAATPDPNDRMAIVIHDAQGALWVADFRVGAMSLLEARCSRPLPGTSGIVVLVNEGGRTSWVAYELGPRPWDTGKDERAIQVGLEGYERRVVPFPQDASTDIDGQETPSWTLLPIDTSGTPSFLVPGSHPTLWRLVGNTIELLPQDEVTTSLLSEGCIGPLLNAGGTPESRVAGVRHNAFSVEVHIKNAVPWEHLSSVPIGWCAVSRHGFVVWWQGDGELLCRKAFDETGVEPRRWSMGAM